MRIAIYSRKSKWTGKGDSVENQVIMCREYIAMFIEGGGQAEILEYEDEGFSGKNTKRPQFQKMMQDMKKRHFDYLVCYKLDRLGRNLADLANLMEDLAKQNTSFISIKEKFDTTTPIGKAMLYFSGVLAQMEREQIAERVRDNMIILARSGRWLGGNTPLGYSSMKVEREISAFKKKSMVCLVQNPDEIELAKFIFSSFIKNHSLTKVLKYLLDNGIETRSGKKFCISGIRDILTNPVYCIADEEAYQYFYELGCQVCIDREELDHESGLTGYAKTTSVKYRNQNTSREAWIIARGRHKGIVTGKEFVYVQRLLEDNRSKGTGFREQGNSTALLPGLLQCICGHRMRPKNYPASRLTEKGERTFSYRCPYKDMTHGEKCNNSNVHGNTIDAAVCNEMAGLAKPDAGMVSMLEELRRQIAVSECGDISAKQLVRQEYERKKGQIQNLVTSIRRLENGSISLQYINEEILKLDRECTKLRNQIEAADENGSGQRAAADCVREISDILTDFSKLLEAVPISQKREFMRKTIKKVVWDGGTAHIYLYVR